MTTGLGAAAGGGEEMRRNGLCLSCLIRAARLGRGGGPGAGLRTARRAAVARSWALYSLEGKVARTRGGVGAIAGRLSALRGLGRGTERGRRRLMGREAGRLPRRRGGAGRGGRRACPNRGLAGPLQNRAGWGWGSGRRDGRLGRVWGVSGSGEMEAPARREAGVRTHAQPPTRPRLPSLRRRSACLPACLPLSACLSACDAGRHGQGCRPPVALRRHPSPPPLFSPSCASPPSRSLPSPSAPPPSLAPLSLHHSLELDDGGSGRARSRCAARPCRNETPVKDR